MACIELAIFVRPSAANDSRIAKCSKLFQTSRKCLQLILHMQTRIAYSLNVKDVPNCSKLFHARTSDAVAPRCSKLFQASRRCPELILHRQTHRSSRFPSNVPSCTHMHGASTLEVRNDYQSFNIVPRRSRMHEWML